MPIDTHLGDLIATLFDAYMELYNDAELASVAASATLNDMLIEATMADPVAGAEAA